MAIVVIINQALAFSLELALLAAFGMYGYQITGHPVLRWVLAIVIVAAAVALWGRFAAPNAAVRLHMPALLAFKIPMFGAGAGAFIGAGRPVVAIVFAVLVAIHLSLAVATGQV